MEVQIQLRYEITQTIRINRTVDNMSEQVEAHILKRYNLLKKVGSGAYGHVWKVADKKSGETLALKKIFDAFQHSTDAQRTYREIVFLHQLEHPNIIRLHAVHRAENDRDLYLVFQYMEADLHNAIGQKILKDIHNRFIIYQLIKGMKFLHSAQILHRDLKPSNLLLNSDCVLKICDFGLARSLVADTEGSDIVLTEQVATRWYRAPEVLLGSQNYDKSADMWSIGCILAEVITGKPIFPGNSTLNQLQRILSFTGKPKKDDISALNSEIAVTMIESINDVKIKSIKDWFKEDTPNEAINLIGRMLTFNPSKRITVNQVLRHPYLAKFHSPKEEIESSKVIYPPISDNKKLGLKQYRQLIYDRIKKIYQDDRAESNSVSSQLSQFPRKNRQNTVDQETQPTNNTAVNSSVKVSKSIMESNKENVATQNQPIQQNQPSQPIQQVQRRDSGTSNSSHTYPQNSNYYSQKNIKKDTFKPYSGQQYDSSFHTQKNRTSSAIKQEGSTVGFLQRSQNHYSQQQNKARQHQSFDEDKKKKNSLKDASRTKKPSPSIKQDAQHHQYSYSGMNNSSSHGKLYQKPSTAISYIPSNTPTNTSSILNKFYKSSNPGPTLYKDKVPMKY